MNRRPPLLSIGAALAGGLVTSIAYFVDPARTAGAFLVAFGALLGVALGALALVMIARVTAANWFVAIRRQAEQIAATLPAFAVLFVIVLVSARLLYGWTNPGDRLPADLREVVAAKSSYLNVPFFSVRGVVYFAIWIGLAEMLRGSSLAQDSGDSPALERRMYVTSAAGLVAFALATSFASFDWFMSLSPGWYSTIYGVDYFAGGMVGAIAALSVVLAVEARRGRLPSAIDADHFHAVAKLLLTFVLFWIYIGFSQLIVIWSAEIPAERGWYAVRMRGGWRVLGGLVLLGHFVLPFCALLVRAVKRSRVAMAVIGLLLLAMHYLDVYWIVMPDAPFHGGWGFVADVGSLLLVGGTAAAAWAMRRAGEPAVAIGDRRLKASLDYSTE
ncbi:MAG TPA: hypothetical protein VH277_06930 [Gemmatimonadaceae bacterium]|jgi:hypothetical protein|nr:hypothetical protein [Gemmatimonadaceae bacterium]